MFFPVISVTGHVAAAEQLRKTPIKARITYGKIPTRIGAFISHLTAVLFVIRALPGCSTTRFRLSPEIRDSGAGFRKV